MIPYIDEAIFPIEPAAEMLCNVILKILLAGGPDLLDQGVHGSLEV